MSQPPPTPTGGAMIGGHHLSPETLASLRGAAAKTGVDFEFLVAQASLESGFHADIKSSQSSAAGIFQFTSGAWLNMMRDYGAKHGYADLAAEIKPMGHGHLGVADKATLKKILDLRKDVNLSALLAGELAKYNAHHIEAATGRKATAADLHLAHILGPNGAVRFLKAREHNASQIAADVVPAAAKQNRTLFFAHGSGTPQSVATVYRRIQERLAGPMRQVAALNREKLRGALGLEAEAPQVRTDRRA
jgi:hypothetical protein